MTTTIQRLTPEHASSYRQLMLEAYHLHPDAFTSAVAEREVLPIRWWEARLDSTPAAAEVVFAAFAGGELIGVAGLSVERRTRASHKSTLFGMYVPFAHRGKGIGDELLRNVLAHAKSRPQLRVVQLTVTEGNRGAQGLYERRGFRPFGVEPLAVAVGDQFVAKVHMWLDLRSAETPPDFDAHP